LARAADPVAGALLTAWRAYALPGGEEAARRIRAVAWTERGEIRSSAKARWIPFTASQRTEAARTSFRWDAVLGTGALTRTAVTDACEDRHGWSVAKAAAIVPVARAEGPDLDRGQVQRYLADLGRCPSALVLHPDVEVASAGGRWLTVRDAGGPPEATVDLEMGPEGAPVAVRASRPRMVGRKLVRTPWSGRMGEFREWEGLRVPVRLEVSWHLPEGELLYFRGEATPVRVER
jgi:hypothetical protein